MPAACARMLCRLIYDFVFSQQWCIGRDHIVKTLLSVPFMLCVCHRIIFWWYFIKFTPADYINIYRNTYSDSQTARLRAFVQFCSPLTSTLFSYSETLGPDWCKNPRSWTKEFVFYVYIHGGTNWPLGHTIFSLYSIEYLNHSKRKEKSW